jgi:putative transposase
MQKWNNQYRTSSFRATWWDYTKDGVYHVTICTKDKTHFFGHIANATLQATPAADIAAKIWFEIPTMFKYATLDNFVVMPNHIHGIIALEDTTLETELTSSKTGGCTGKYNPMLSNNLGRVVRWYKGRVSFELQKQNIPFAWQSLYWDNIITNFKEYETVSAYIDNNPANWETDELYS